MTAPSSSERPLAGVVAVVTGASRGVGKGIALGLGEAGATVVVTGRTERSGASALPGSIDETAREVSERGGAGHAIRCDHSDDADVDRLFSEVSSRFGRLDLLVNNVFAIPSFPLARPFWELPIEAWDTMHRVGLRSHYVASVFATRAMLARPSGDARLAGAHGLIVNVSSWAGVHYAINVAYSVGKGALDRLSRDGARELRPHRVAMVSLVPGIVRTERVLADVDGMGWDLSNAESPLFSGRAVAALGRDRELMTRSGKALVVAELATELDFVDEGGGRPRSLRRPA